ncbi:MAG TPA: tetratricopeptide repeat protein [Streptosporangiaceae bacterium]|nr:tetratricopeptide repeat protein [Streptosporangiaceae bacterium]
MVEAPPGVSFGALLRQSRLAAALTQEDLSGLSGLSVRTISGLEAGRTTRPHWRNVLLLADALGLTGSDRDLLLRLARRPASEAEHAGPQTPEPQPTVMQPVEPSVRPAQLPPDIAEFTGRAAQAEWLIKVLARPGPSLSVAAVTGAGGTGKSALAIHVAHRLSAAFPDGQLFVELQGSGEQPVSPDEALARLLRHLGVADSEIPADLAERTAEFRTRMADRSMLLVLDDARDAAHVRPLLPGSSECAVLVTSRGLLADLEGGRVLELGALTEVDALTLFTAICGPRRAAAEPGAVAAVLSVCGGLPLAIRIAASRLVSRPGWSVAALAWRLRDERRRLSELAVGDLAVRTSFQVSYATLAAGDGGRAFRLLGLWPGADISLPAAAALLGLPAGSASEILERLVDIHLLETPAADRYRFHDLIAVFAAECAGLDEPLVSRQASVGRILRWYLHSADLALNELGLTNRVGFTMVPAETHVLPLTFVSKDASAKWCENERDNVVSAVGLARRNAGPQICAQLAEVSFRFVQRSPWGGWIDVLEQGIDCADGLDDAAPRAWLRCFLGITKTLLGRHGEAIEHLEEALELSRMTGNRACEALAIGNLAVAYKELKRYDDAIASLEQVLIIDPHAARPGHVLVNLGMVYVEAGRLEEGTARLEDALKLLSSSADLQGESMCRSLLADAYRKLGRTGDAISSAERALEISQRVHHEYFEAAAWSMLGQVLADSGRTERARYCLDRALRLAERLGVPEAEQIAASLAALASDQDLPEPEQLGGGAA